MYIKEYTKNFQKTVNKLCTIPERYNKTKELVNKLEDEGKILVIRPQNPVTVSRLEKDTEKLEKLYKDGIKDAENKLKDIRQLIRKSKNNSKVKNNINANSSSNKNSKNNRNINNISNKNIDKKDNKNKKNNIKLKR